MRLPLLAHVLLLAAATRAVAQAHPAPPARGSVIRVDSLGPVSRDSLVTFAAPLAGNIPVHGAVRLYRVVYRTTLRGRPADASGLLAVPDGGGRPRGTVMFLHGTNVTRALAPSQPGRVDGNEEAAVFGGNGYVVVVPDYLGLGESTVPQPYMVADAQRDAAIDMLVAVRSLAGALGIRWNPTLLLLGFSQGGHSVAAVQRELERRPRPGLVLHGAAAVAGAFALRRVSLPYAVRNGNVGYLTFVAAAYCLYYGHPLTEAFTPGAATALAAALDGTRGMEEIAPALAGGLPALFAPGFAQQLRGERTGWFTRALDANALDRWVPRAPLRLYNSQADEAVSPADAATLRDFAVRRGGRVTLHSLGAVEHQEGSRRMYAPVRAWFDSLTAVPVRR